MLIFSRRHLRAILSEYLEHYNTQRPHHGHQLRPPRPQPLPNDPMLASVYRRPIVGGLINEYHQAA